LVFIHQKIILSSLILCGCGVGEEKVGDE